jgi:prophage regulatory protein
MSQRVFRVSDLATTPATAATRNKKAKSAKQGILPVSPATLWRWVREDRFVKPFKLSEKVTVWDAAAVEAWLTQRAEGGVK